MVVDTLQTFGVIHSLLPLPFPTFPSLLLWRIWDVLGSDGGAPRERGVSPSPQQEGSNFLDF